MMKYCLVNQYFLTVTTAKQNKMQQKGQQDDMQKISGLQHNIGQKFHHFISLGTAPLH